MSTPMNPGAESARENARQKNGEFGTQPVPEVNIDDLFDAQRPAMSPELADVLTRVDELDAANDYHDGSMLPHGYAGDCGKCQEGTVYRQVREEIAANETDPTHVAAFVARLRKDNEADYHDGSMRPHQSASDCAKCLRKHALDQVAKLLPATPAGPDFSAITDPEWRAACEDYSTRYAAGPDRADVTFDWNRSSDVAARDVQIGARLRTGQVVTSVDATQTPGVIYIRTDGHQGGAATVAPNHGDPIRVHDDRVDLSDPDWFEAEANRITARTFEERYPNGAQGQADYDEVSTEVRRKLTRLMQPTNISPLHVDESDAANGRAKVGDDVIFSQPMYGSKGYRIIGKRAYVAITGHDGTSVTWAENGEVEYITQDLETGHQSTSNLRGHGWRRVPAPGDYGLGAQSARPTARPSWSGPEAPTVPGYRSLEHQLNEGFGV